MGYDGIGRQFSPVGGDETPVEERIDHEEAKRIAEQLDRLDNSLGDWGDHEALWLLAQCRRLLTEHSAQQEVLRVIRGAPSQYDLLTNALARAMYEFAGRALPATEPAQPEEERHG